MSSHHPALCSHLHPGHPVPTHPELLITLFEGQRDAAAVLIIRALARRGEARQDGEAAPRW